MLACGWYGSDNIYMFRVYDSKEFKERVDDITSNNWKVYLGLQQDYYYFNADEVIKAAQKKERCPDGQLRQEPKELLGYLRRDSL